MHQKPRMDLEIPNKDLNIIFSVRRMLEKAAEYHIVPKNTAYYLKILCDDR